MSKKAHVPSRKRSWPPGRHSYSLWLTANQREVTTGVVIVSEGSYALPCHLYSSLIVMHLILIAFVASRVQHDNDSSVSLSRRHIGCLWHANRLPYSPSTAYRLTRPQHE